MVGSFSSVLMGKKNTFPFSFYAQGLCQPLLQYSGEFKVSKLSHNITTVVRAKYIQPTKLTHQVNKKVSKQKLCPRGAPEAN